MDPKLKSHREMKQLSAGSAGQQNNTLTLHSRL